MSNADIGLDPKIFEQFGHRDRTRDDRGLRDVGTFERALEIPLRRHGFLVNVAEDICAQRLRQRATEQDIEAPPKSLDGGEPSLKVPAAIQTLRALPRIQKGDARLGTAEAE